MGRPCYNALNDSQSWVIMLLLLKHDHNILFTLSIPATGTHNNYYWLYNIYLLSNACDDYSNAPKQM